MPNKAAGVVIHSILKLFTFCKNIIKIQVFVQNVIFYFFKRTKIIMQIKVVNLSRRFECDFSGDSVNLAQISYDK